MFNIDELLLEGKEIDFDIEFTSHYSGQETVISGLNIKGLRESEKTARLKFSANYYNKNGEKISMSPLNDVILDIPSSSGTQPESLTKKKDKNLSLQANKGE